MKPTKHNIERIYRTVQFSVWGLGKYGSLYYDRITEGITLLANMVHEYSEDFEDIAYIENNHQCEYLMDFIVGAYWHYTEWHGGQWSPEYRALCALGQIFDPGMTMPESENETYQSLELWAKQHFDGL